MTSASSSTVLKIWRREAPIVRSVANSRVRCAIVIESEFAITNAPTKSAIPPNASRKPWRNVRKLCVSLASSEAWPSPVRTWVAGGRMSLIEASSSASVVPSAAAARIWSSFPSFSKIRLRGRQVERCERRPADVALRGEVERGPTRAGAARRLSPARRSARRPRCPSSRPSSVSTATSPAAGQSPSLSTIELKRRLRRVDREAEVRRAAELDHVAVVVDQLRFAADAADRRRPRPAAPAPRRAATRRTTGSATPDSSLTSKAVSPVMTASVPW